MNNRYVFKHSFSTICENWSGPETNREKVILMVSVVVVLAIALALEALAMPVMYKGISGSYDVGTKPIGGVLFVATFFHITLLAASLIGILYVARRLGMAPGELLPKSRTGWIDIMFLMILLVSGFVSWFAPLALIFFIISGVYLVASELQ